MTGFAVEATEPLQLKCRGRLANMYVLSPYVWEQDGRFHLLLRAVPRRDDEPRLKMAEVWYGQGHDGLSFEMDEGPTIFPGPDLVDLDGCEDPTVVVWGHDLHVWYTGWNQSQETGRLVHAIGPDARHLEKRETAIDSSAAFANPKEATVTLSVDGRWRMFFEFARDEASKIGVATADTLEGPWEPETSALTRRAAGWDEWHMSSGPVIDAAGDAPVMFYNGATQDAHWRIGWAQFDASFETVVERCDEPLITPKKVDGDKTDIAFAASALVRDDIIWLYYSISDQQIMRACVRRT
jgi:predicted GH43/DUF377 family glycosyl hydrolase